MNFYTFSASDLNLVMDALRLVLPADKKPDRRLIGVLKTNRVVIDVGDLKLGDPETKLLEVYGTFASHRPPEESFK